MLTSDSTLRLFGVSGNSNSANSAINDLLMKQKIADAMAGLGAEAPATRFVFASEEAATTQKESAGYAAYSTAASRPANAATPTTTEPAASVAEAPAAQPAAAEPEVAVQPVAVAEEKPAAAVAAAVTNTISALTGGLGLFRRA